MKCRVGFANPLPILLLIASTLTVQAAETAPNQLPERPYLTIFVASIDRILQAGAVAFDAIDRHDISKSLGERLDIDSHFAGIDKSKPLGVMNMWDGTESTSIVFLPVEKIDELLKSATFGIVGFHKVSPDQYEIERPGSPYHVLVRKGDAMFADSVASIRALRITPERMTQGLRERHDIGLIFDAQQIPQPTKEKIANDIRMQVEPFLQQRDDDLPQIANLRKTLGKLALDYVERSILDTKLLNVGARVDSAKKSFVIEATFEAVAKSPLATWLNGIEAQRNEFSSLMQSETPAGLTLNLPVGSLMQKVFSSNNDSPSSPSRIDATIQLAGSRIGDFAMIAALHGPDVDQINEFLPNWILKLEESGQLESVKENAGIHRGVVIHRMVPRDLPTELTSWIGSNIEVVVGQGKQTIWICIGGPEMLLDHVKETIDKFKEIPVHREKGQLVSVRIQGRKLPEIVESTPLSSNPETARDQLAQGDDGISLIIEPINDGLRLKLEAEEGFVRLYGRDWALLLDSNKTGP